MERTESGLYISSSTDCSALLHELYTHDSSEDCLTDKEAADLVRAHVLSLRRDSQPARILRSLIHPRHPLHPSSSSSSSATTPTPTSTTTTCTSTSTSSFAPPSYTKDHQPDSLDDAALHSLFGAANALFFANRLSRRVTWDWSSTSKSTSKTACSSSSLSSSSSSSAETRYEAHVVGTTALRRSTGLGGWETLIVLSAPILRDARYSRRLLIATFLHEMIHSFLFVTCGLGHAAAASAAGHHTPGFRAIAETIDGWVGRDLLRLADVEADLEWFRHCRQW
ncbi:SprT-like family [Geosmithia morbida]|uniref:SprT-like family n=1 Tax=Geosmithia morbida TaxID=1094350 RepID=A0A9P4Z0I4_9HYPO|nr:SprT-like family [Geosmithia morbida]KAF4125184.1 SprT-like family [Geosmithia morbida]